MANVINQVQHWEVADPLHVLKCQRCMLRDPLSFSDLTDSSFNAQILNDILKLGPSLEQFSGLCRMNDVLAIALFPVDNWLKLFFSEQLQICIKKCPLHKIASPDFSDIQFVA
jgi:hypothetical protein